mgnify:FL=1
MVAAASDEVTVAVTLDAPAMLVLTDNYNPAWRVRVDGVEKKVIPVYHTFMGVMLERGTYQVVFRYEPPYAL